MQIIICYMNCWSVCSTSIPFPLQMINCEIYSLTELVLPFCECEGNERLEIIVSLQQFWIITQRYYVEIKVKAEQADECLHKIVFSVSVWDMNVISYRLTVATYNISQKKIWNEIITNFVSQLIELRTQSFIPSTFYLHIYRKY